MHANSENVSSRSTERQRKAQSLNVATSPEPVNPDSPSGSPPQTPGSPNKMRPISMFVHPQERMANSSSEQQVGAPPLDGPPANMPFSLVPAVSSEVDVASLSSSRTVDTSQSQPFDQESVSSDTAERDNDSQGFVKLLCEIDGGLAVALNRAKQDALSAKEAATFLKKRASIEDEYGRMMIKLAKSMQESHHTNDTKRGSYGESWVHVMKLHESIGENRVKFAAAIQEISEEVSALYKETEKSRKNLKDSGHKYERGIQEAEQALEKAKSKYETHSEDWERMVLQKNGDTVPNTRSRTLTKVFSKQPKSPTQLIKLEEDARNKAVIADDSYKYQLSIANTARHDYYDIHLPRMITALKDISDECDIGIQYHLARYAYLFENTMVSDALVISPVSPEDGPVLRRLVEQINNEDDYSTYVQSYISKARKVKNFNIPYDQYNMSEQAINIIRPKNTFGVDLAGQMQRDGVQVPPVLVKCTEAIEQIGGLEGQGIYRVSGIQSHIQRLRNLFDKSPETANLFAEEELIADVNNVSSLLKLWFRELPDPLFTRAMYYEFINAAKIPDDKKRVLELHDRVNHLPDPNYSTLKYLMGHLHRVVSNQDVNKMTVQNLGIVWGPTLMGNPLSQSSSMPQMGSNNIIVDNGGFNDMVWQCRVVETILENYQGIFIQ